MRTGWTIPNLSPENTNPQQHIKFNDQN